MLFPEEIFKMILKQHKLNHIKERLNDVINYKRFNFYFNHGIYILRIKKLEILIDSSFNLDFDQVLISYCWEINKFNSDILICI